MTKTNISTGSENGTLVSDPVAERKARAKALGAAFQIAVDTPNGKLLAFIKKPSREVVEQVFSRVVGAAATGAEMRIIEAGEIVLRSGWIDEVSDGEILVDADHLVTAAMAAYKTVDIRMAEVEKL